MKGQRSIFGAFVSLLTGVASSVIAAPNCDAIIVHGMRNIEVSQSTEAAVATKYFNHCQKNFESLTDESLASAEVEIFGQGAGGGDYSRKKREERLSQWCTTNSETAISNRSAFSESQVFYQGAVSAWEKCNALQKKDIIITPVITPDTKTVNIGIVYHGNADSVLLYGLDTEGFSCNLVGPDNGQLKLPYRIKNRNVQATCYRDAASIKQRNGQEYDVLPRGTIAVKTASEPFQLYFPEEWNPGIPVSEAEAIKKRLPLAESPIGTLITTTLPPEKFSSPLNPQYSESKWIRADGRPLPPNSIYGKITGERNAPDMRNVESSFGLLDVVTTEKKNGENVISAKTEAGKNGEWKWFLAPRDIHGNRYNNDYEQDADNFQIYIDAGGAVIVQGRTLNFKHGRYGGWAPGVANLLGLSIAPKVSTYNYIKVN